MIPLVVCRYTEALQGAAWLAPAKGVCNGQYYTSALGNICPCPRLALYSIRSVMRELVGS